MPSDKRQRQRENAAARAASLRAASQRRANRRRAIGGGTAVVLVVGIIAVLIVSSTGSSKKSTVTTPTSLAGALTTLASPTTVTTTVAPPPTAPPVKGGQSITGPTSCPSATGAPRVSHFAQAPPTCIDPSKQYTAKFDTSEGSIVVALNTANVAGTVNNFVVLSRYHYYDGSSFDRIDQSIDIIQGGSPTTQSISDPGPGYTINDEPGPKFTTDTSGNLHGPFTYGAGDLVMARGAGAKSAAAQYFFVVGPAASALNSQGTYVVFGHVTTGLPILLTIEKNLYAQCPSGDQTCLGGAPSRVVLVRSITITEQ